MRINHNSHWLLSGILLALPAVCAVGQSTPSLSPTDLAQRQVTAYVAKLADLHCTESAAVFPALVPSVYSCLSFLNIRQLRLLEVAFLLNAAKAGVHHFPDTPQAFGVRRKAGPWS